MHFSRNLSISSKCVKVCILLIIFLMSVGSIVKTFFPYLELVMCCFSCFLHQSSYRFINFTDLSKNQLLFFGFINFIICPFSIPWISFNFYCYYGFNSSSIQKSFQYSSFSLFFCAITVTYITYLYVISPTILKLLLHYCLLR